MTGTNHRQSGHSERKSQIASARRFCELAKNDDYAGAFEIFKKCAELTEELTYAEGMFYLRKFLRKLGKRKAAEFKRGMWKTVL